MGLIVDTNVFIRAERTGTPLDLSAWHAQGDAFIAAITASELLVGVHRANTPTRRIRRAAFVEAILTRVPVLPFDLETARVHSELHAALPKGAVVGAHDLLVAATAVQYGHAVLTGDAAEFGRIKGLTVYALDRA